jgi:hypothetical protein
MQMSVRFCFPAFLLLEFAAFCQATVTGAQAPAWETASGKQGDPSSTLVAALSAACRMNDSEFASFLPADNAAAFRALPSSQKIAFMRRLSLTEDAGHPLLSSDVNNRQILRCEATDGTSELRLGEARIRENLAFIPVSVPGGEHTQFGMVREGGGWKILSLGLVLFDIPELSQQWAAADISAKERVVEKTLQDLAATIRKYDDAFGRLPESLSELGPAPKDQISPEQANLIDASLADGKANGYNFRYRILPNPDGTSSKFELAASPADYGKTGIRSFFLDSDGNLHGGDKRGAVANLEDPVVSVEKSD